MEQNTVGATMSNENEIAQIPTGRADTGLENGLKKHRF